MRKWGLHASCTRFVSFSDLNEKLKNKFNAVAKVEASFISNTRPGVVIGDVIKKAVRVYEETGFPEEWKKHHQGGLTGYVGREFRAIESMTNTVKLNQAYAWNPSITGTKMEDTILVGVNENKIITHTGDYEYIEVEYNNTKILRPGVLIRKK
jgi:Xaa-Pro aminopeptidase